MLTKIKNLFGINKFPMGKHVYFYILELTKEERNEFSSANALEKLILWAVFFVSIIGIIFIHAKINGAV